VNFEKVRVIKVQKEKSLAKHILINVFLVTIIIAFVILIVIWLVLCKNFTEKVKTDIGNALLQKAEEMHYDLENQFYKTDNISGNLKVTKNLDKTFSDGYEVMSFIGELNVFMDAFERAETPYSERILIYTTNDSLLESKYLRKINRLNESDEVFDYFKTEKKIFYWSDKIKKDSLGRRYLTILRHLPIKKECIIEIKLYFDDRIQNSEYITECDIVKKEELKKGKNTEYKNVFENYFLKADIPKKLLSRQYILYFLQLLVCAVIFLIIAYILAWIAIKHALVDIMVLVDQIVGEEFLLNNKRSKWFELKKIQDSIFSLNRQIYDISRDKYEIQLHEKKLEVENLNLKINPHMLYNSLSVIKMAAFKKQDYETEKIIDLLVEYYRLMLNKGEEMTTLGQELTYLEKYIKINEISKKVRYNTVVDISNDAYDITIPHLILQPIVENAVFHGLYSKTTEPSISFEVSYKENILKIVISDNGVGIPPEKLKRMNNQLDLGYGLKNVIFRLEYYYKNRYSLRFESPENGGTSVIITIREFF